MKSRHLIAAVLGVAACIAGWWYYSTDDSQTAEAPLPKPAAPESPKAPAVSRSLSAPKSRPNKRERVINLEAQLAELPDFATQAIALAESDVEAAFAILAREAERNRLGEWNVWLASTVGAKHPEWMAKLVSFTRTSMEMQSVISSIISENTFRDLPEAERVVRTELEGPAKQYGMFELTRARVRRWEITEAIKLHAEMPASPFRGTALRVVAEAIQSRPPQIIKNWIGELQEADRVPAWQIVLLARHHDGRLMEDLLPAISDPWQRSQAIQAVVKSRMHRGGDSELQPFIDGLAPEEQAVARAQMETSIRNREAAERSKAMREKVRSYIQQDREAELLQFIKGLAPGEQASAREDMETEQLERDRKRSRLRAQEPRK